MPPEILTEIVILGAGTAGMYALREVRRAGRRFVMIDPGPLGTTCARVGCMPSKVALHAGAEWATRKALADLGAQGVQGLSIDLSVTWAKLREQRDFFSNNAASKARAGAKERLLEGKARFLEPTLLEVETPDGVKRIRAEAVVIATGSHPVVPGWLAQVQDRTVTTDGLFELPSLPARVGILGLGAIGLEMGLALSRLGVQVVGADLAPHVAGISDPILAERARARFGREMDLWLGVETRVERTEDGVRLRAGEREVEVDLLLAALGLAITFGLLGVINMAHGEMLMLGAYSTYVVQLMMQRYVPAAIEFYPLIALPVAFFVTATIGMALERTVIRHLYGRPLETLLATWGISLMLIQLVRLVFGAQNVEVANPAWLSGGIQVLPNLVLPYNRIVIIAFALFVVVLTWLLLNKTRLGLNVRAVTQNRNMAACCGVPTGRVDMLAFGLGSGIAGLGGVALSQIGNVGPDLGQSYIIDSFLVVVLGGVGQLAGSVMAAFGLGIANKILEPQIGAVLGKILILALIILFIQKRPQGLFALKGRVID